MDYNINTTEVKWRDARRVPFLKEFLDPLAYNHFAVEGDIEFKSILYVPGMAPFEQQDMMQRSKAIKLYVRRVFISAGAVTIHITTTTITPPFTRLFFIVVSQPMNSTCISPRFKPQAERENVSRA